MKTRSLVFLLLGAIAGLGILAIAVCGGFVYYGLTSTDEKLSPVLDELFTAIEQGKFVDTYDSRTAPEFREVMTREQYDIAGKTIAERLGPLKSRSIYNFKMNTLNGKSYLEGSYKGIFEKGEGEIQLNTREIDGQRKIAGFFVKSPLLAAPAPKPGDKPAAEKPADEKPTDEKPTDEKQSDEKPAEPKPAEPELKAEAKEPAPAGQP